MEFFIAKNVTTSPAVYKMSIDNKWFYIGSSINPHKRVRRWKCALKNHKHLKSINIKQVLTPESKVMFIVIELAESVENLRQLETKWIQKYWDHPGSLNRCPTGNSINGMRPYNGWKKKEKIPSPNISRPKPIACFNKNGGLITTYDSTGSAARALKLKHNSITAVLNGKRGQPKKVTLKRINPDGSFEEPKEFIRKRNPSCGKNWKGICGDGHPYSKAVLCYKPDGTFVKRYGSLLEAERETGAKHQNIRDVINGHKKTIKGYAWKYA